MTLTQIKTAIVPVAGLGTRLLPISAAVPKELLPLGRRPALHLIAEELGQVGVERIILVSSNAKQQIADYFRPNPDLENKLRDGGKTAALAQLWSQSRFANIEFEVVIQHEQRGLGHAVLCAAELVTDEPVIVALGDCVMGVGGRSTILTSLVDVFQQRSAQVAIAFEEVPEERVSRYGIAEPKSAVTDYVFELADVIEKPSLEAAPSRLAIAARYVLGPAIFEQLRNTAPGKGNEIQLTDAIRQMIARSGNAFGVVMSEPRFDMGNIHSYVDAFVRFALADPELREDVLQALPENVKR